MEAKAHKGLQQKRTRRRRRRSIYLFVVYLMA
jgi:hypothetical protein